MKKTTRKSFSRKAIVVVMSVFLTVSLTAVGFASWLISNNDSKEGTGNVTASNVSDAILQVTINKDTDLGSIKFAPLKTDVDGDVRFDTKEENDFENLKITVTGKIEHFDYLEKMSVQIKVPDSVITAAGYKSETASDGNKKTYVVDETLPKYIVLPAGATDMDGNLIATAQEDYLATNDTVFKATGTTAEFKFDIAFKWGTLFNSENPGIYLDKDKKSITNLTDLLNIANAESATANYTELTAEAKRDILTAMKKAIAASEAKFTVVVNAQAK